MRRGWTAIAAGALLIGTAACFARSAPQEFGASSERSETTVLVENTGIEAIAIYSTRRAARLGTVMPGRSVCVELPETYETQQLVARPVAGGEAIVSPRVDRRPGEGWEWSIGRNSAADQLSLVPHAHCGSSGSI